MCIPRNQLSCGRAATLPGAAVADELSRPTGRGDQEVLHEDRLDRADTPHDCRTDGAGIVATRSLRRGVWFGELHRLHVAAAPAVPSRAHSMRDVPANHALQPGGSVAASPRVSISFIGMQSLRPVGWVVRRHSLYALVTNGFICSSGSGCRTWPDSVCSGPTRGRTIRLGPHAPAWAYSFRAGIGHHHVVFY